MYSNVGVDHVGGYMCHRGTPQGIIMLYKKPDSLHENAASGIKFPYDRL